jgi:hypothetical protein
VYYEAAQALAERMIAGQESVDASITYGARLVLSREPTERELAELRALFQKAAAMPSLQSVALTAHGNSRELTGMTAVASVLINLDASLTR